MPAPDDEARATLVANERAKLSASYTNGLAIAIAVVGGLSPILTGGLSGLADSEHPWPRARRSFASR